MISFNEFINEQKTNKYTKASMQAGKDIQRFVDKMEKSGVDLSSVDGGKLLKNTIKTFTDYGGIFGGGATVGKKKAMSAIEGTEKDLQRAIDRMKKDGVKFNKGNGGQALEKMANNLKMTFVGLY